VIWSKCRTDPGGALFADGAGAFEVIASLPLADGYSLTFRNFDVLKQKPQMKQLKDKQTVWIDKATRKVLKISAVLPNLLNGILSNHYLS